MTVLFTDPFDRSNESLDASANWTERHDGSGDLAIVSNKVELGGSGSDLALGHTADSIPTSANYKAYVTINWEGEVNSHYLCAFVRRVDDGVSDSNFYGMFVTTDGSDGAYLYLRDSGGWTLIDSDTALSINLTQDYVVTVEADGSTISGDVDGAYNCSGTNTTLTAAGDAGIATGTGQPGTGVTWDDFNIEDFLTGGNRIMSSLARDGGLAGRGGIAGFGGGLAG